MRHGKKNNHLGRTASHRKSLLSNLANSLILNKRIVTTLAKAKELRKYVEPILTKSKDDSTHNRRIVFSYLKNKESIKALFGEVSEKIASRNGGYTRIIKLGTRSGDAAETAMIELVDYNELLLTLKAEKPARTRRSRRSAGGSSRPAAPVAAAVTESISDAAIIDEAPVSEASDEITESAADSTNPVAEISQDEPEAHASEESSESTSDEKPEESSGETEEKPEA
jgi:large subunit ribosomal protein L17